MQDDTAYYTRGELANIFAHAAPQSPPPDPTDRVADDPRAARFGQYLFFDTAFSANGKVSCATCHQPARGFTDGLALAHGIGTGTRHTPTVLGDANNHWYFWDGRTDTQWSQALQPFENKLEIGTNRVRVVRAVAADPALRAAYVQIFGPLPASVSHDGFAVDRAFSNLGKAIEAYERRLTVGTSPFDRYLAALRAHDAQGEQVISPAAKRGLALFTGAGNCELCHSGPMFSDEQFHNIGLPVLAGEKPDPGRLEGIALVRADPFNATGRFSDDPRYPPKAMQLAFLPPPASELGAFKTPTLRNVAIAGPYMHDGRFTTLAQVLDFYARGKAASTGRLEGTREETTNLIPALTPAQQADLEAFLETLTDRPLPAQLTRQPATP